MWTDDDIAYLLAVMERLEELLRVGFFFAFVMVGLSLYRWMRRGRERV